MGKFGVTILTIIWTNSNEFKLNLFPLYKSGLYWFSLGRAGMVTCARSQELWRLWYFILLTNWQVSWSQFNEWDDWVREKNFIIHRIASRMSLLPTQANGLAEVDRCSMCSELHHSCYRLNAYFPPNSNVETLTLHVAVFGHEASKKVIKVKWCHKSGALI